MPVVCPLTCYGPMVYTEYMHSTGTWVLCLCTGGGYWIYNFDHYTYTHAWHIYGRCKTTTDTTAFHSLPVWSIERVDAPGGLVSVLVQGVPCRLSWQVTGRLVFRYSWVDVCVQGLRSRPSCACRPAALAKCRARFGSPPMRGNWAGRQEVGRQCLVSSVSIRLSRLY
jgi:hypothetical protein